MNSGLIGAIGFMGRSGTTDPSGISCVGGPNGWKFVGGKVGGAAPDGDGPSSEVPTSDAATIAQAGARRKQCSAMKMKE